MPGLELKSREISAAGSAVTAGANSSEGLCRLMQPLFFMEREKPVSGGVGNGPVRRDAVPCNV
jgi:hypothetical protein